MTSVSSCHFCGGEEARGLHSTACPTQKETAHFSGGKSAVDQIPPQALLALGDVYRFGAEKYERDNWKKGTDWSEFYGSALRHLYSFWSGEDRDTESGMSHLSHALFNIITLWYYSTNEIGTDNRCPK